MKIYIHVIDGSDCWMPAEAKQVDDGQFEVVVFDEFDPNDNSVIPQFILGDIVTIRKEVQGNNQFWLADRLIKRSTREDKMHFEFLYRTIIGDKLKDSIERYQFRHVIKKIRDEIENGSGIYYPAVENYVKGVETKRK